MARPDHLKPYQSNPRYSGIIAVLCLLILGVLLLVPPWRTPVEDKAASGSDVPAVRAESGELNKKE